ncbi:unnamed protein product [Rhizophagus irregularis]|nr:unnamed protein product [Rhizophagus irregularis]CAB5369377.1 unnamed protein product [Rhizophagus irregularis]
MEQPSVTCFATQYVDYLAQIHDPKTLKCSSSQYQRQREQCLTNVAKTQSSSYVPRYNRSLQNRRIQRKIRQSRTMNTSYILNYFTQFPIQNTSNNPFANQIFNGINF